MNITEDYVSFEVAKLLKEKGFNEQCRAAYTNYGQLFTTQIQQYVTNVLCSKGTLWECTAPTHQMATKWLREEKNVYIEIRRSVNTFLFGAIIRNDDEDNFYQIPRNLDSYEKAVEAALKYSLENLI